MKAFILAMVFLSTQALADAEFVFVSNVSSKKGAFTAITKNGETYNIERGDGCPALWRQKNKFVILYTSDVNSNVIIPDENQACEIVEISDSRNNFSVIQKSTFPECVNLSIWSITPFSGSIILNNGNILQSFINDKQKVEGWLPASEVSVCGYFLINQVNGDFIRFELIR